jgi:ssDNA-binding replication factor A large subunit
VRAGVGRAVPSAWYEKVRDRVDPKGFEAQVEDVIREWGGLLDRDAAEMVVVERLGGQVASFTRIADLEEGMEANLRATVTGITPVRTFTRQDGTGGRVVNLELRDESGFCRFVLWDDDVALVERGKMRVGSTVRALDCYVKRTNFGLDVVRGKFGALVVEAA